MCEESMLLWHLLTVLTKVLNGSLSILVGVYCRWFNEHCM